MEWSDNGIVLSARKHGETSLIVSLLTECHGRHAGLVRGGAGRRNRGLFEPGNLVRAQWRARLPDHLGTYTCELTRSVAADLMRDRLKLSGLSAVCAVTDAALSEREPHQALYQGLLILLDAFADDHLWPTIYVRWELGLLQELGFSLDLSACAATGKTDGLAYVSPKSGKAVSETAAAPYKDVLLPLPAFLLDSSRTGSPGDIHKALKMTGYFLNRHAFAPTSGHIPEARNRLMERFKTSTS
ncbi:MAG: DNA repair protein RecO [Rhodospirillales bacterium]|nr:DNA repair protein RecO [Rhodospirillales bacterium]